MESYISKSALVAEIESKKKRAQILGDNAINSSMQQFFDGMKQGCVDILSFLNTLEVKEVGEEPVSNDLEEAIKKYLKSLRKSHFEGYDIERAFEKGAKWQKEQMEKEVDLEKEIHNAADQYDINNNGNIYWEDIVGFAKHFFELGLKAQKGE